MPTDNNKIITLTDYIEQSLAFIQHNNFVLLVGPLAVSLDGKLLNWSVTFHALWSPEHCIPSVSGSDKLDYYTHSF